MDTADLCVEDAVRCYVDQPEPYPICHLHLILGQESTGEAPHLTAVGDTVH